MSDQAASPGKSWSITARLTLFYSILTSVLLLLASFYLYRDMADNLQKINDQFLTDKIQSLQATLEENPAETEDVKEDLNNQGEFMKYYARILDTSDHDLGATSGMNLLIAPSVFPPPTKSNKSALATSEWISPKGRTYYLAVAQTKSPIPSHPLIIQVALDVTFQAALMGHYRNKLLTVLCCGLVLSSLLGFVIARRCMGPLQEITNIAQGITASGLQERIGNAKWPHELQALAAAFDRMMARLEESFTRLSRFAADLAHELRTPINNLMGEAEVALTRAREPDKYRQVLESSLEEYARLSNLIDSVLFLARMENAETPIKHSVLDAGKEVKAVCEFYEALAAEHKVEITCEGTARVNADPLLLRRALSNVISNSIYYTPYGGRVMIQIREVDDQSIQISVRDTGCGIPAESLPRIFDRFFRTNAAYVRYQQGAGLGLAIVKSVMELHRGSVGIQSEPTIGTTVTLNFPLSG